MNKFIALMLLMSSVAYGQDDQTVLDGGIGVFNSAKKSLSETKMFSLGIQEDVWGPLKDRGTLGGWLDNSGNGKKNSAFAAVQIGYEVQNNGWIGGIFTGPGAISTPDSLLGGNLQFMDEIHFGLQDCHGSYIGALYRHFSSAGIYKINIGRDIIGVEIRF